MRYDLRAMSVGEIFDRALRIYLGHFGFLLAVSLAFIVPLDVLYLGVASVLTGSEVEQQLVSTFVTLTAGLAMQALLAGALVQAVSDIYLGVPVSLGRCFRAVGARIVPLFFGTFVYTSIVMAGMMACIFPGIYFMGALFAVIPVIILERAGPIAAIGRSWNLSWSMRRRAFAATFFAQLMASLVAAPVAILDQYLHLAPLQAQALSQTVAGVVAPYASIVLILLYYDYRIRKEAFDLQVLASELHRGGAPPAPVAGAA
jgi:hypothetical protein